MEHTKGNWKIGNSGGTVEEPETGYLVCTLRNEPLAITPEVEGNARLIAACPEMLTTLDAIKNDTEDWLSGENDMPVADLMQAIHNAANKAFEQATEK